MKESQLENKTAIATNDYVRMVDENNNSVKIKKDSFMAAIRDALPSIISDGATGGGSVLSIINGALKTRTDANLASVLGVGVLKDYSFTLTKGTAQMLDGKGIIMAFSCREAFQAGRGIVVYDNYGTGNANLIGMAADVFSNVKDNPNTINFYTEGSICYVQQNKFNSPVSFWVRYIIKY